MRSDAPDPPGKRPVVQESAEDPGTNGRRPAAAQGLTPASRSFGPSPSCREGAPAWGGVGSQVGYTALRGKERRQVPSHLKGAQGSAHHHWVSPWALTCHRLALLPASLTPTRGPPIGRSFPGRRSGAKRHQPRRGAREDEPGLPQPKGSATPTHSPSSSSGTPGRIWSGTWSSGWRST